MEQRSDAWLLWRKNGIGSSDAAVIMGTSPWKDIDTLLLEKSGQVEEADISQNFAVQRGIRLEPMVRAKVEMLEGREFPDATVIHPEHPFMRASLDGYNEDSKEILEIKVVGIKDFESGIVPDKYYPQLQHQMFVSGAKKCLFASYYVERGIPEKNGELKVLSVDADPEYQQNYFKKAKEFWGKVMKEKEKLSPIIKGLGASLFIRDGVRLGYCFEAAIRSVAEICEEVVVLDCGSTDGTLLKLELLQKQLPNLKVFWNQPWDIENSYLRLSKLANIAKGKLTTPWHLMIQADEVLHEKSYKTIREIIETDGHGFDLFSVRRYNLYRDLFTQVNPASNRKPCSDVVYRLGRTSIDAVSDAESLSAVGAKLSHDHTYQVVMFHYGFVRPGLTLLEKAKDMQSWFHGAGIDGVDKRVIRQLEEGSFNPLEFIPETEYIPIDESHPKHFKGF